MNLPFLARGRQVLVVGLIVLTVLLFSRQVTRDAAYQPQEKLISAGYAGSEACASCHKDISADHRLTAHFRTSAYAGDSSIRGSFRNGENEFRYSDELKVRMERRDSGLYQVLYAQGQEQTALRFDIVVGSGTKGQTYLYWGSEDRMYQLPISYFTPAHTWSNSPGYPGIPVMDRKVTGRCLECHASAAVQTNLQSTGVQAEFDPQQLVLTIGCERCHGPAAAHVVWHKAHPKDTIAHNIISLAGFTRKQKLDLCRFCHGGNMPKTKASFTYQAGANLNDYFAVDSTLSKTPGIDVHGNQYGLLAASLCFRSSEMTCNTCHNSHREERDNVALFAARCQTCHEPGHSPVCKLTGTLDSTIMINCVECHMPRRPSRAITMYLPGDTHETPALMRTHQIAVYSDATDQVLAAAASGHRPCVRRVFDMKSGKWHYENRPDE